MKYTYQKLFTIVLAIFFSGSINGQFFYDESCRNSTGIFQSYGHAPGYTAGPLAGDDQEGQGWLRLTNDIIQQVGYVLLDGNYPSDMGVTVEFDFKIWKNATTPTTIADGFSVFLFDGNVSNESFQIGGAGGSLGYAPHQSYEQAGLGNAYLGIAIDYVGNFAATVGKPTGAAPNSITIADNNYKYVDGTAAQAVQLAHTIRVDTRPDDNTYYRRVKIEIEPSDLGGMDITVYMRNAIDQEYEIIINTVRYSVLPPQTLRLGFAAATGSGCAMHEVRDVIIRTPGDLSAYKSTEECVSSLNDVTIYTNISYGLINPVQGVVVSDTLPANFEEVSWNILGNASFASMPVLATTLPDQRKVYNYSLNINSGPQAIITATGNFPSVPALGTFTTGVKITPPVGFNDDNLNDNEHSLTVPLKVLQPLSIMDKVLISPGTEELNVNPVYSQGVTYKWSTSTDGINWTDISGAVSNNYTTPVISQEGIPHYYRCTSSWDSNDCTHDLVFIRRYHEMDNISDADCFIEAPAMVWDIDNLWSSENIVSALVTPLVGDLNDDGIPEIVCLGEDGRTNIQAGVSGNVPSTKTILVYDGKTHERVDSITLPSSVTEFDTGAYGLVKTSDRKGLIVVATIDGKLRAYDITRPAGDKLAWESDVDYGKAHGVGTGTTDGEFVVTVSFADFNNDGIPEVYVRDKIYNAETGKLLAVAEGGNNTGSSWSDWTHSTGWKLSAPIAADMDGDGKLELILGNEIYEVDIRNTEGRENNSIKLKKTITPPTNVIADGHAQVVDFDGDGYLDIFISNRNTYLAAGTVHGYVWDVRRNTVSTPFAIETSFSGKSYPLVGDIDNDGRPEILIQSGVAGSNNKFKAFKYNPTTRTFSELWNYEPDEDSFSNGATLFDFNLDGMNEILISDQSTVSILNGSGKSHLTGADTLDVYIMGQMFFGQGTCMQYPIIVDVDGDGSAKLVAAGNRDGVKGNTGTLNIFKSKTGSWAPARKVWNQYSYNVVNINEDLTVPKYQLNPATIFPGKDGILGTADDVQPYNSFLSQQTILNKNGTPLFQTPDFQLTSSMSQMYYADGDSVVFSFCVENKGDAQGSGLFYVSVYKNNYTSGNAIFTQSYNEAPLKDETICYQLTITGFSDYLPFSSLYLVVNDNGEASPVIAECDYSGNIISFDQEELLIARNDFVSTITGLPVLIKQMNNDSIPASCTQLIVEIEQNPQQGTAILDNDNNILYTSVPGFTGYDVLIYRLTCGDRETTAKVTIYVAESPDNLSEEDCYIDPPAQEWTIREVPTASLDDFTALQSVLVGDLDDDGLPEIVAVNNVGSASNKIRIMDSNLNIKKEIDMESAYNGSQPLAALGKIKWTDGNYKSVIFTVSDLSKYLYAYTMDGNSWVSDQPYNSTTYQHDVAILLVDLDGDGYAEIVAGNKVYAAETGKLLCELSTNVGENHSWSPNNRFWQNATADLLNLGRQQICIGNEVYDVTLTNRNGTAGNSVKIVSSITPVIYDNLTIPPLDGCTQVVDFDLDGNLDIVVSTVDRNTTTAYIYIWSPIKKEVIASAKLEKVYKKSVPFIGDIDGDGYPEIVMIHGALTGNNLSVGDDWITALKYDPSSAEKEMKIFWQMEHDDTSGATSITLFDFNQDGIAELVYRDERSLRIINGSGKSHLTGNDTLGISGKPIVYDLIEPYGCWSATTYEYPVIADIDGDGQAEIIVAGPETGSGLVQQGPIRIFKSGGTAWAPARPVWNQYSYNAVNVNDDLTIPRYPVSPATIFAGRDGIPGTADDVRPYNGFLMQQTVLSKDGLPLFLTPKAVVKEEEKIQFYYDNLSDTLTISNLFVANEGSAPLNAPVMVSVYKSEVDVDSLILTYPYTQTIEKGETHTLSFDIPDFSAWLPVDGLIVRINDGGNGFSYQIVCDSCCVDNENEAFANLPLDVLAWADNYRKCEGDNVQFETAIPGASQVSYTWYHPDNTIESSLQSPLKQNLTIGDIGCYVLEASGINTNLTVRYTLPHLSVAPSVMYWRQDAEDSDWNNINNWSRTADTSGNIQAIPAGCTEVHLVANTDFNPSLDSISTDYDLYGNAVAGKIIHHSGSDLGWPHLLEYNRAVLRYNFGNYTDINSEGWLSNPLERDIWHLLATPLKKVASGDFSLAGYPYTWQSLYRSYVPGTGELLTGDFDRSFNDNSTDLQDTYHALVLKIASQESGTGYNDHRYLEALGGIIELPYYDNASINQYRPGHSYNMLRGESNFYYYDPVTLLQAATPPGILARGEEAYRYIFEDDNNQPIQIYDGTSLVKGYKLAVNANVVEGDNTFEILIGNPFVSSIDSKLFYEVNKDILDQTAGYKTFNGSTNQWVDKTYSSANRIEAFEAFVVTLNQGSGELLFPLEGDYALTGPVFVPGDNAPAPLIINLNSQGKEGVSQAKLDNERENEQVSMVKMIHPDGISIAEVFLIEPESGKYVSTQTLKSSWNEIGIGIRSNSKSGEELELSFDNLKEFVQENGLEVLLVDKILDIEQNVRIDPTYKFTRIRGEVNNNGMEISRFLLKFVTEENTGEESDDILSIGYTNGTLYIHSTNDISSIHIYDISGSLVYNESLIKGQTQIYNNKLSLASGIYIVKVEDNNGKRRVGKIITE